MSSWLDQKPRALVELFINPTGFIVPLWRVLGGQDADPATRRVISPGGVDPAPTA